MVHARYDNARLVALAAGDPAAKTNMRVAAVWLLDGAFESFGRRFGDLDGRAPWSDADGAYVSALDAATATNEGKKATRVGAFLIAPADLVRNELAFGTAASTFRLGEGRANALGETFTSRRRASVAIARGL